MIKCKDGCVEIMGTGEDLIKDWICVTAALHENMAEIVGVEKANAMLTKSLFTAVAMANKKEGKE